MLHSLSKRIAFFVCEKTDLLPLEIYVYGFELIISSIIETSALLLVGFLIGKIIETMLFLFSFSSIRFFYRSNFFRCSASHHRAAAFATFWSHINDIIGCFDDFKVMLNDYNCIATFR